ncbi:MAG TPA: glutamine synthetase family protein, partial [archaeon]|nr:glutamine synthetase family protein [archaeon]
MTTNEEVLQIVEEKDVKFIRLWFTDILGTLKSFAITKEELETALDEGMGFDGSSIMGYRDIEESDMVGMPDPDTFKILPWRPQEKATARMFVDVLNPDGSPFEGDPRYVLKRNLKRAADKGYTFYVGPELEYFYFKSSQAPETIDRGGYFDLTPLDLATDLRRQTVFALENMGIKVEYSHHEVAPSQHEIDLRYNDALQIADDNMTYKLVVKEVAQQKGLYATFMPKPIFGENGSGMHVHQSLFKGSRNAFYDANEKYNLSAIGKSYIAGILKHAYEMTSVLRGYIFHWRYKMH